ncbi:sigma-70 family RNA polymerase sigma factor [Oceanicola sp. S124]|uniref:sigma-70 family RNA polymerase sigma factor n=1 Tax=Oceanicola sp. S124 TaxID=1042378 RepID=UPI003078B6DA
MLNPDAMPATLVQQRPAPSARRPAKPNGWKQVSTEQELTEQTSWMLAVRDQRDRAAFARLFAFYAPRVKGVLMRSGMGSAAAEDVVQDVMLAVWHKAAQFDPGRAQVSGWIYRIARNRQVDIARKNGRPIPEEVETETPPEADPGAIMALAQESGKLRQALAKLKPEQREVIARAYLGDLTHGEIRDETGLPLGTIKSRIRLGLERLRHELKDLRSE